MKLYDFPQSETNRFFSVIPENSIYLDNAATSLPKPPAVTEAVDDCIRNWCGNPGRGGHYYSLRSAEAVWRCREALSDFFGLSKPENVIFTLNTTYALNLLLHAVTRPGDHILISDLEHNSVLRPVEDLRRRGVITYDTFSAFPANTVRTLADLSARITPATRAVFTTAQSNICSVSLPLREIGKLCREKGILLLVDGAQAGGHMKIDMERDGISALALPSHKGLFGIQGAGALLVQDSDILEDVFVLGGSGYASRELEMPRELPEKYEAGTLPTPAIVGLHAGIRFLQQTGIDRIAAKERKLSSLLLANLSGIPGVTVYGGWKPGSVVSFTLGSLPAEQVASALAEQNLCVRAGLHCAPLAHRTLQTPQSGTVRVSFSFFNSEKEVSVLTDVIRHLSRQTR